MLLIKSIDHISLLSCKFPVQIHSSNYPEGVDMSLMKLLNSCIISGCLVSFFVRFQILHMHKSVFISMKTIWHFDRRALNQRGYFLYGIKADTDTITIAHMYVNPPQPFSRGRCFVSLAFTSFWTNKWFFFPNKMAEICSCTFLCIPNSNFQTMKVTLLNTSFYIPT